MIFITSSLAASPDKEYTLNMNTIYLSQHAGRPLIQYLKQHGFNISLLTGADTPVYQEISTHPDIHMCQLGLWDEPQLFMGNIDKLARNYPGNIIYNAICTSEYFIHNLKYTDSVLLSEAVKSGRKTIHVPQGYSRCSCLPVTDNSFITSDAGMQKALEADGAHVLFIQKGHVLLPGFDYGFIGGCAGHITINGKCTIIFNGNLSRHPDYKKIAAFIKDRDIEIVYFDSYPLEDIGSILTGRPL